MICKTQQIYVKPDKYNIEKINFENEFSNPHTYIYYTKAVIDASNKKGAVISIECLDDECMTHMIDISEINDSCDKLTLR